MKVVKHNPFFLLEIGLIQHWNFLYYTLQLQALLSWAIKARSLPIFYGMLSMLIQHPVPTLDWSSWPNEAGKHPQTSSVWPWECGIRSTGRVDNHNNYNWGSNELPLDKDLQSAHIDILVDGWRKIADHPLEACGGAPWLHKKKVTRYAQLMTIERNIKHWSTH